MTMIFWMSIISFCLSLFPVSECFVPTSGMLSSSSSTTTAFPHHHQQQQQHGTTPTFQISPRQLQRRFPFPRFPAPLPTTYKKNAYRKTSTSALSLSLTTAISSIPHVFDSTSYCFTALLLLSTFGITLERQTTIGKALSAPLATMALALLVANLGIIPFASPVYNMVNAKIVPLAVPMLLFDSDLRKVWRNTGSLLLAFALGAVATVIGTLGAFPLLCLRSSSSASCYYEGWKVACALTARHIGGAINFVAVAETLNIAGTAVSATIAADNVVVALYFMLLFAISKPGEDDDISDKNNNNDKISTGSNKIAATAVVSVRGPESVTDNDDDNNAAGNTMDLGTIAMAMTISSVLVTVGGALTQRLLPPGTSSLPLTSTLTVLAATAWPTFFSKLTPAGTALGILGIQLFFAASGAAGSISLVLQQAPMLFLFSMAQIAIHFAVLMALGRGIPFFRRRLPLRELYVASNANVGGPTTAAAMAQAKDWKRLVVPGLLVGILGYATATPIALGLAPLLLRWAP